MTPIRIPSNFLRGTPPSATLHKTDFTKTTPPIPAYKDHFAAVIDNFLTESECRQLLHLAEHSTPDTPTTRNPWERALLNIGGGQQIMAQDTRNCGRIIWDSHDLADRLLTRLMPFLRECDIVNVDSRPLVTGRGPTARGEAFVLSRLNERFRFLRYEGGEYFRPHADGCYVTPDETERSLYTVHLYLNGEGEQDLAVLREMEHQQRRKDRREVLFGRYSKEEESEEDGDGIAAGSRLLGGATSFCDAYGFVGDGDEGLLPISSSSSLPTTTMNNEQFRRLVLENTSASRRSDSPRDSSSPQNANAARSSGVALGSRMKSSIPMTPRSVTGVDFARQLAEYRRESQPPAKRFRSSAAPKGTKLPSGYQDRAAQLRAAEAENEEKEDGADLEKRLKALEEMVTLGQIDQETFDKLRRDLGVGGDLQSTHLVKGLDWDLLRRVKTGEDVAKAKETAPSEEVQEEDVDEAFDRVLEEKGQAELPTAPKMKEKKRGTMAPPPPQKKSRDEILRELKASRAVAAAAAAEVPAEPALGARFKRIGDAKVEKKRWVEQDETGRRKEILQITDAEGKTKRKVRWLDKPGESQGVAASGASPTTPAGLLVPDKDSKPLGMEVPAGLSAKSAAPPEEEEEEEEDDIFAGVGADYDPLGDVGDESDSSEAREDGQVGEKPQKPPREPETKGTAETEKAPPGEPAKPRNYFGSSTRDEEPEADDRSNPLTKDPTLLAALKRAATLRQGSPSADVDAGETEDADAETLARRRKFLEEARRRDALDAMDMDMGFGSSRIEDEEDEEGVLYDGGGGKKRKRGPKKRKGDKESASDVMRVLEGRKKE
ncbi:hypothetical protein BJX96DRAFT_163138 [Aspergillus floccosus]